MERLGYVDTAGGRRRMVEELDRRALSEGRQSGLVPLPEEVDAPMSHLRRGWYWGSQEFAEKLRGMLGQKMDAPRSRAYVRLCTLTPGSTPGSLCDFLFNPFAG
jgi:REP-associated tyrosine transposase